MQKLFYPVRSLFLGIAILTGIHGFAAENPWQKINEKEATGVAPRHIKPKKATYFKLDINQLKSELLQVPMEQPGKMTEYGKVISLPMPDGEFQKFAFSRYIMMEPGLVPNWPEVYTFTGQGIDDPTATIKVDITPMGFHSMVLREGVSVFIDPVFHGESVYYQAYAKTDLDPASKGTFTEWGLEGEEEHVLINKSGKANSIMASGTTRREYRVAIACTGEYTTFHGGATQAASAITTTLNRVNGVYEKEVCVRMNLITNNNQLIYTTASSDPYTNNNGSTMLGQNQTNLSNQIGLSNFDIGHVFSTGGGGIASLGSVCVSNRKGQGVTGSSAPVGDAFDIDYVAHEMGHQFAGNHTFNATTGSCGGGNRNANTAYEPGSGSTIMAYAGICGSSADLQPNSDDYFVFISYQEITNFITNGAGNGCAVQFPTGNNPPTIPAITGGMVLPISTPFKLTAPIATDPEGDVLTYTWEENDLGAAGLPTSPSGTAPIFRTFKGTTSRERYFPKLSNIIAGTSTIGEILPTYARNLNFKLTVRDNKAGGGGVNSTTMNMSVVASAGPFLVTSPNTNSVIWEGGSTQTVTWNVANTAGGTVNSPKVRILLSTDGGNTYPHILSDSTNNDGSQSISVPFVVSTTCRVMVASYNNFFFDISNANFRINAPTTANIPFTVSDTAVCPGQSFKLGFDPTGPTTYLAGNIFSVQLSNASGAFTNPTTIGTKQTTSGPDTITCIVPGSVVGGNGYKLRIVSSNPVRTSTEIINAPKIRALPANPGTITGQNEFCPNASNLVYSIPNQTGLIGFNWQLPVGAIITSTPADSNVIVVSMGTAGGQVSVNGVNGCGAGPVSALNVNPISVLPAQISVATTNTTVCQNTPVIFSTTIQNGGNTPQYKWFLNGNEIQGVTGNSYTTSALANGDQISAQLISSLDCNGPNVGNSNVITMTVTPLRTPVALAESNALGDTVCTNEAVTFTVTPTFGGSSPIYQWYRNTTAIVGANQNSYTVSNLVTGDSIRVRMTSNATCLTSSIVFSNAIKLKFRTLTANAGADTNYCEGSNTTPIILRGIPAGGAWTGTGIQGNGTITAASAGNYSFTYSVSKWGCTRTDGKIVTIKPLPVFSLGADAQICRSALPFAPNSQTGLSCQGSAFSGNLFTPSLAPVGPYTLICSKSLNGCVKADTVIYNIIAVDTVFYSVAGNILTANSTGNTYQWYQGSQAIAGATNPTYTITTTGIYCVEVTFPNGCKRISSCSNQIFTSVAGQLIDKGIQIFPNPAAKELTIRSDIFSGKQVELTILNALGQQVKSIPVFFNGSGQAISLENLANGMYFIRATDQQGATSQLSFIKE